MPGTSARTVLQPQKFFSGTRLGPVGSDEFAAIATGVGNVTGALSVAHVLATTPTGVGAVSGALSVKHSLAASPTGVGRSTAALSVAHSLSTGATGVGRVTGALTVTGAGATLAGTPTGVGRVTGALSLSVLVAATVTGVAAVSGDLSGGSLVPPEQGGSAGGFVPYGRRFIGKPPSRPQRRPARPRPQRRPLVVSAVAIDDEDAILALYGAGAINDEEFAALIR
jgi:hypothetical protein